MDYESSGFLSGWKAIAGYCGVSVRTLKRWFYTYNFPVVRGWAGRPMAMREEITKFILRCSKEMEASAEYKEFCHRSVTNLARPAKK